MRGRSDSSFATLQSVRSQGVSSNRQRRLTGDAQSRAGDQALAPQMYLARSHLKFRQYLFSTSGATDESGRLSLSQRANECREWSWAEALQLLTSGWLFEYPQSKM